MKAKRSLRLVKSKSSNSPQQRVHQAFYYLLRTLILQPQTLGLLQIQLSFTAVKTTSSLKLQTCLYCGSRCGHALNSRFYRCLILHSLGLHRIFSLHLPPMLFPLPSPFPQMLKTKSSRADFFHSDQKRVLVLNGKPSCASRPTTPTSHPFSL